MERDPARSLPCLIVATGPFTTITLDSNDELTTTLEQINRHQYDRVRLCRTTMDVDVGLGPLPAILTYTSAWLFPPMNGLSPSLALDLVNKALFELLLGGIDFDSAAPEDVGHGYAYHTGYFVALGSVGASMGVNLSKLKNLQANDVSTFDSIELFKPRSFTKAEINSALLRGRSIADHVRELNPTIVLDGLTALKSQRATSSLIFLWSAVETLIGRIWNDHVVPKGESVAYRRDFVTGRGWTPAHKSEVMFQLKIINDSIYDDLNRIRRARNDVAHEGAAPTLDICGVAADVMFNLISILVPERSASGILELGLAYRRPAPVPKPEPVAWRHLPAVPGSDRWGDAEYPRYPEREWVPLSEEVRAELTKAVGSQKGKTKKARTKLEKS